MKKLTIAILITSIFASFCFAKPVANVATGVPSKKLTEDNEWTAKWISDTRAAPSEIGVFLFRKSFELPEKPKSFVINVSGDNRYQLYVNGTMVCFGPARGCLEEWYYETIDIAPFLKKGKNVLAAEVFNYGHLAPQAQVSNHTGFIVQSNSKNERAVDTNSSWKVNRNYGREPVMTSWRTNLSGCMEKMTGQNMLWGWEQPDYDDSKWGKAGIVTFATNPNHCPYGTSQWSLSPRAIPLMEQTEHKINVVRRYSGIGDEAKNLESGKPTVIPANSKCKILLDQTYLITAYPELLLSGGKDAVVKMTYGENLYGSGGDLDHIYGKDSLKGNRNDIDGKDFWLNPYDIIVSDGAKNRLYKPLWFRTYRYLELEIETKSEPLTIESLCGIFTAYPFKENASFSADNDESLKKIWNVGWWTARLCANETYFDCPFYEQLQYVGDTRIQALISLYVSGDSRLMKNAINAFYLSRNHVGITKSRTPERDRQMIPGFSVYWINMLRDFHTHCDDPAFVEQNLNGVRTVINWWLRQIDSKTGMLKSKIPYWNFMDWVPSWRRGIAPSNENSGNATASLHLSNALEDAAALMTEFGYKDEAKKYLEVSDSIKKSVMKLCWSEEKGLLRDCAGEERYSQHANIMGILTDTIPQEKQLSVYKKIIEPQQVKKKQTKAFEYIEYDGTISEATFYYKFYLFRAMKKVGESDSYIKMLQPWKDMIAKGLTTFSETPDPCRSECHAWSSSPNYYFLSLVCGINPSSSGYKTVEIKPSLGELKNVSGKAAHPLGMISTDYRKTKTALKARIELPKNLTGTFVWQGKEYQLKEGVNEFTLENDCGCSFHLF